MAEWMIAKRVYVPAYEGRSIAVKKGEQLSIIDVCGQQVGNFVCFLEDDPGEWVSPSHTRAALGSISLKVGDCLYSNRRRPLMQLVRDTVGKHGFFMPACDSYQYSLEFRAENHPNCSDNLKNALSPYRIGPGNIPDPVNWFMNCCLDENGNCEIRPPLSKAGDYVRLKALENVIIAICSCSQDILPVNALRVGPLELQIFQSREV